MARVEFLQKVATRVRPSIIFDSNGTILSDVGGMELVEKFEVINEKSSLIPQKVILTPKKLLSYMPVLTSLGEVQVNIFSKRGKGLSIEYEFGGTSISESGHDVSRYRLDFITG